MKKKSLIVLACSLGFILAACGETGASSESTTSGVSTSSSLVHDSASSEGEVSSEAEETPASSSSEEEESFAIAIETDEGVSVVANKEKAPAGEEVELTITLAKGYRLKTLTLDGEELPFSNGHASFEMPEHSVVIAATSEKILYTLTIDEPEGVSITANTMTPTYGEEVVLTYVVSSHYELTGLTMNGETLAFADGTATFAMPDEDVTIAGTSTFTKGILEAPENVALNGLTLTFDAVEGATNGYAIRVNEDDDNLLLVNETTVDLEATSLNALFKDGANTIEVRAEGTELDTVSAWSAPVAYLKGVDEEAVSSFVEAVEAIGEVTSSSLPAIEAAKAAYEALDDISLLDPRVDGAKETLDKADGTYFKLLVEKAAETGGESDKAAAVSYYENDLDAKESEEARAALSISISTKCDAQFLAYDTGIRLYIYATGINILGQNVEDDSVRPVVRNADGTEMTLLGGNGAYYLDNLTSGDTYRATFEGEDLGTFTVPTIIPQYCVGISWEGNAFGTTGMTGQDRFGVDVYLASDVTDDFTITGPRLGHFTTDTGNMGNLLTNVNEFLYRSGYAGETLDLTFIFYGEKADGSAISAFNSQGVGYYTMNVMTELRLATYGTIRVIPVGENDEGRVEWAWEIFQEVNPQYASVDALVFDVLDKDGATVGTIVMDYEAGDRYLMKADVEAWLAEQGLPEGDYCFSAYLRAKEGSEYSDSNRYPTTEYYHYVPTGSEVAE